MDGENLIAILKTIGPLVIVFGGIWKICQKIRAKFANFFHKYDKYYRERHGTTKVSCVGMQEPIALDDVYTTVQFLDQRRISKYKSLENLERTYRQKHDEGQGKRQDATKVANGKQYLMVLGAPGVGKSTFLRKVGLEALKKKERNFDHECTPVFLELKRCIEDPVDIETLIINEFRTCGYLYPEKKTAELLKSGELLILLDGLDEVPAANINNVILKIGDFVDQYSQNRFIASCRIASYKEAFTRFTEVEIAEFDDSQVKAYIDNWFASTCDPHQRQPDERMKTAELCWKTLNQEEHEATKELARNPLSLMLLCIVYDDLRDFPPNRANLYEKALNIFLKEWAAEKRVLRDSLVNPFLDALTEKQMLSEIAAKNFKADRVFLSEKELIDQIKEFGEKHVHTPPSFDATKVLETIVEQGLFVERDKGVYFFFHLTFQEYLTANYIAENEEAIKGLVTTHLFDERWREIFLLTAGIHKADNLLVRMEAEAAKFINTDRLKSLFRWAKGVTIPSGSQYAGIAKRMFAIRQYFYLWVLNKINELSQNVVNRNLCPKEDLHIHNEELASYIELYSDLYLYRNLSHNRDLCVDVEPYINPDIKPYLDLYVEIEIEMDFYSEFKPYNDLYGHMEIDLYPIAFSEFDNQSNGELDKRIPLVEHIEQAKTFKGVDLQQLVQKFNEERKLIDAARQGKSIKLPEGSIHNTWISALGITEDMLAISHKEMEGYIQHLRAVELIAACKEAARYVTPGVWEQIEDRLLA